tara:strand:+ start:184 stop:609 length:426 start_codon:yes stop_codon:yes gene_type:complete
MKKFILIILFIPGFIFGQTTKKTFIEMNVGIASVDDYDFSGIFPGTSVLFGKTTSFDSGLVTEAQIGLALPSILTAKLGFGAGNLDKNILLTLRPWPFFIGPQLKLYNFTASFEIGLNNEFSFESGLIATLGYRWKLKNRK